MVPQRSPLRVVVTEVELVVVMQHREMVAVVDPVVELPLIFQEILGLAGVGQVAKEIVVQVLHQVMI
jgi:hypothetical protein